jgi:hypothetical protein
MELIAFVFIACGVVVGAVPAYLWGRGSALADRIAAQARENYITELELRASHDRAGRRAPVDGSVYTKGEWGRLNGRPDPLP